MYTQQLQHTAAKRAGIPHGLRFDTSCIDPSVVLAHRLEQISLCLLTLLACLGPVTGDRRAPVLFGFADAIGCFATTALNLPSIPGPFFDSVTHDECLQSLRLSTADAVKNSFILGDFVSALVKPSRGRRESADAAAD